MIILLNCIHYTNELSYYFSHFFSPVAYGISDLHDYLMYFLIVIFIITFSFYTWSLWLNRLDKKVYWAFLQYITKSNDEETIRKKKEEIEIFVNYSLNKVTHAPFLEFVWTALPGSVLVGMIIPSFMLLYAIDDLVNPDYTTIVTGNQWYWTYEYSDYSTLLIFLDFLERHIIEQHTTSGTNFSVLYEYKVFYNKFILLLNTIPSAKQMDGRYQKVFEGLSRILEVVYLEGKKLDIKEAFQVLLTETDRPFEPYKLVTKSERNFILTQELLNNEVFNKKITRLFELNKIFSPLDTYALFVSCAYYDYLFNERSVNEDTPEALFDFAKKSFYYFLYDIMLAKELISPTRIISQINNFDDINQFDNEIISSEEDVSNINIKYLDRADKTLDLAKLKNMPIIEEIRIFSNRAKPSYFLSIDDVFENEVERNIYLNNVKLLIYKEVIDAKDSVNKNFPNTFYISMVNDFIDLEVNRVYKDVIFWSYYMWGRIDMLRSALHKTVEFVFSDEEIIKVKQIIQSKFWAIKSGNTFFEDTDPNILLLSDLYDHPVLDGILTNTLEGESWINGFEYYLLGIIDCNPDSYTIIYLNDKTEVLDIEKSSYGVPIIFMETTEEALFAKSVTEKLNLTKSAIEEFIVEYIKLIKMGNSSNEKVESDNGGTSTDSVKPEDSSNIELNASEENIVTEEKEESTVVAEDTVPLETVHNSDEKVESDNGGTSTDSVKPEDSSNIELNASEENIVTEEKEESTVVAEDTVPLETVHNSDEKVESDNRGTSTDSVKPEDSSNIELNASEENIVTEEKEESTVVAEDTVPLETVHNSDEKVESDNGGTSTDSVKPEDSSNIELNASEENIVTEEKEESTVVAEDIDPLETVHNSDEKVESDNGGTSTDSVKPEDSSNIELNASEENIVTEEKEESTVVADDIDPLETVHNSDEKVESDNGGTSTDSVKPEDSSNTEPEDPDKNIPIMTKWLRDIAIKDKKAELVSIIDTIPTAPIPWPDDAPRWREEDDITLDLKQSCKVNILAEEKAYRIEFLKHLLKAIRKTIINEQFYFELTMPVFQERLLWMYTRLAKGLTIITYYDYYAMTKYLCNNYCFMLNENDYKMIEWEHKKKFLDPEKIKTREELDIYINNHIRLDDLLIIPEKKPIGFFSSFTFCSDIDIYDEVEERIELITEPFTIREFDRGAIELLDKIQSNINSLYDKLDNYYDNQIYELYYSPDTKVTFDSIMIAEENLPYGYPRLLAADQAIVFPINTYVRILVTSNDVIHSWALPSHGIKMDAVPGRLNQVQFISGFLGTNWGQCSELCGINHAFMPIEICALEKLDFLHFLLVNLKIKFSPVWINLLSYESKILSEICRSLVFHIFDTLFEWYQNDLSNLLVKLKAIELASKINWMPFK